MTEREPIHTYHPPVGQNTSELSVSERVNAQRVIDEMNRPDLSIDELVLRDQNLYQIILASNIGIIPTDILEQVQSERKTNSSQR